jgi:hypothetical protein
VDMEETDLKAHYRPIWFRISVSQETVTAGITTFSVARETLTGYIFCASWLPRVKKRTVNVHIT